MGAGTDDYDRMYEDDDTPELGSMEGHGSVIHHLLSQVASNWPIVTAVIYYKFLPYSALN